MTYSQLIAGPNYCLVHDMNFNANSNKLQQLPVKGAGWMINSRRDAFPTSLTSVPVTARTSSVDSVPGEIITSVWYIIQFAE